MKSSFKSKLDEPEESSMKKVFASYHFCQLRNPLIQGFGNFVGQFNMDAYTGEIEKFILHLENHLKNLLEEQFKEPLQVKVLFFR